MQAQVDFTPSFPSLLDCEWPRLLRQLILFQPALHIYRFLVHLIRSELDLTPVLKRQRSRWDGKRSFGLGYISISYEMQPFGASVHVEEEQFYTRSRFAQCTNSSTRTTAAPASSILFLAHPLLPPIPPRFSQLHHRQRTGALCIRLILLWRAADTNFAAQ